MGLEILAFASDELKPKGEYPIAAAGKHGFCTELLMLFEAGKVVPIIDRSYPLSEVPEALRYLEAGHVLGKVVITIGDV